MDYFITLVDGVGFKNFMVIDGKTFEYEDGVKYLLKEKLLNADEVYKFIFKNQEPDRYWAVERRDDKMSYGDWEKSVLNEYLNKATNKQGEKK